jgi:hypothetical protein
MRDREYQNKTINQQQQANASPIHFVDAGPKILRIASESDFHLSKKLVHAFEQPLRCHNVRCSLKLHALMLKHRQQNNGKFGMNDRNAKTLTCGDEAVQSMPGMPSYTTTLSAM